MTAWLTILLALWIYPIAAYFLLHQTSRKPKARKYLMIVVPTVAIITMLGLLTNVSTTLSVFDWFCVTSIYLSICLLLWYLRFQPNKIVKVIGLVAMVVTFTVGYIAGTIGILGIGFVIGSYDTDRESWLGDGLIYKESILGNAISDYRGKKVEVYRTLNWLPVIEWRIQHREYYNSITYLTPLTVDYKVEEKKLLLSASAEPNGQLVNWADTLQLNERHFR